MERELWPKLYRLLRRAAREFHQQDVTYQPWVVVAVFLWAVLHDRPIGWACRRAHWSTTTLRPLELPSAATMSRRLKSVAVGMLLRTLHEWLREGGEVKLLSIVDGKPLPVGGCSKDPDAKVGRGAGMRAKGYKLHAIWNNRAVPEAFAVTPLNLHEAVVAQGVVSQIKTGGGYLLADGNYDSSAFFDQAAEQGFQMLLPMENLGAGKGHHYQSPYRLRAIEEWRGPVGDAGKRLGCLFGPPLGRMLHAARPEIERRFANAVSFGGGMGPLSAWVRRLPRVWRWVAAKLTLNGVRILSHQNPATTSSLPMPKDLRHK